MFVISLCIASVVFGPVGAADTLLAPQVPIDYADLKAQVKDATAALQSMTYSGHTWDISVATIGKSAWSQSVDVVTIALAGQSLVAPAARSRVVVLPLDSGPPTPAHGVLFLIRLLRRWAAMGSIPKRTVELLQTVRLDFLIAGDPDAHSFYVHCDHAVRGLLRFPDGVSAPDASLWTVGTWNSTGCSLESSMRPDQLYLSKAFPHALLSGASGMVPEAVLVARYLLTDLVKATLVVDATSAGTPTVSYQQAEEEATGWWAPASAMRTARVVESLHGRRYEIERVASDTDSPCDWLHAARPESLCLTVRTRTPGSGLGMPFDAAEVAAAALDLGSMVATNWGARGTDNVVRVEYEAAKATDQPVPLGWDLDGDGVPDVIDYNVTATKYPALHVTATAASVAAGVVLCILGCLCHGSVIVLICVCFCPACRRKLSERRSIQLPDALGGGSVNLPGLPPMGTAAFDLGTGVSGHHMEPTDAHERLDDEELHSDGEPRRDGAGGGVGLYPARSEEA
eukprot:TRINITY_DN26001_c0_g1_i1.p1 TRINITY_DN26001_c0_g1~~TRINITY_DN26001_c0_g1_i1.p1  ORF type:complete len:513 (-),score=92.67 TRINITY_DN26001_c0_g1_i1:436-1974(-)